MNYLKKMICSALFLVLLIAQAFALSASTPVAVSLIAEEKSIHADQPFWLLVTFTLAPYFHLYWQNPGDSAGSAPKISWQMPDGFTVDEVVWPTPARIEVSDSIIFGYSETLMLLVKVHAPGNLKDGTVSQIGADASWVVCGPSTCIPGKSHLEISLKAASQAKAAAVNEDAVSLFLEARRALPKNDVPYTMEVDGKNVQFIVASGGEPFTDIQKVEFYPLQTGVFDTHKMPVWKVQENGKKLVVIAQAKEQSLLPSDLKGVLVVSFTRDSLRRDLALKIDQKANAFSKYSLSEEGSPGSFPLFQGGGESGIVQEVKTWYSEQIIHFRSFFSSDFSYILFLAFVGGIILNFMPCVLPVITLKVLHFVQLQGQGRGTTFKHGLSFSFGVLLSFWILAGAIYSLQALGKTVGWGFQLQEPLFVAALLIVLFILALCLFGVFEFGTKVASFAGGLDEAAKVSVPMHASLPSTFSSFCSGVLATFVASPCTGPLLGSAIGFTATLDPLYSFTVFTFLGLGMAFPYLFLSLFPELTRLIPKPGRWMTTFKQLMGFFLLATVLWLIWVLEAETNNLSLIYLFTSFFIISFGLWIYGTWGGFDRKSVLRAFAKLLALICIVAGSYLLLKEVNEAKEQAHLTQEKVLVSEVPGKDWETFSPERLEELRSRRIPVFVDFSAKWCLTCQANSLILETESVKEAFLRYGVVKMLADWTQNDETITKFLRSLGRNGVPVYALYGKNPEDAPFILPEVLTPEMVIEALKQVQAEK